jgi:hypothetical protein
MCGVDASGRDGISGGVGGGGVSPSWYIVERGCSKLPTRLYYPFESIVACRPILQVLENGEPRRPLFTRGSNLVSIGSLLLHAKRLLRLFPPVVIPLEICEIKQKHAAAVANTIDVHLSSSRLVDILQVDWFIVRLYYRVEDKTQISWINFRIHLTTLVFTCITLSVAGGCYSHHFHNSIPKGPSGTSRVDHNITSISSSSPSTILLVT